MAIFRIALVFHYDLGYSRGVLRGIKQYAQSRPNWVLVPLDTEGLTREVLAAADPRGVIASVTTASLAKTFHGVRKRLVNVASVVPGLRFPRVGVDHRLVGQSAAEHLLERGLRHFAFVGHPNHLYSTEREAGFVDALQSRGHFAARYYERRDRSFRRRGRLLVLEKRLRRWLKALPQPVGVFACHDVWGLQVVEACRLAGLHVPEDVAVIGVDNDDLLCELARPSLSSVIVPAERVGYEAAALLDQLLTDGRQPRSPLLIAPPGVVTRQSSDVLALEDPIVSQAVRFLRDHAHLPLRVADVLRAVPVSRRALKRRFQATLRRGLGEEIRRLHVEKAKQLLVGTELAMHELATQAGFSSQYQLSRVFRRDVGYTPTAYRQMLRNPPSLGTKRSG